MSKGITIFSAEDCMEQVTVLRPGGQGRPVDKLVSCVVGMKTGFYHSCYTTDK